MTPTLTINHMSTKLINLGDAINPTHGTNKRYVDTKTNNFLRTDGMRAMTGDLNMNTRRILNLRQPQSYENTHAVNVGFLKKELSYKPLFTMNIKSTSVIDSIILCQVQIRKTCQQYLVDNPSS